MSERLEGLARVAYDALETRTREDGSTFVTTKDDAPEWVRDVVMAAHGDMLPDDWRYVVIHNAFGYLADGGDPDDAHEFADGEVDTYTAARFAWLASNLRRQDYVDGAAEEYGHNPDGNIADAVGLGQYVEASEVFGYVVEGLREHAEEDDDEGE